MKVSFCKRFTLIPLLLILALFLVSCKPEATAPTALGGLTTGQVSQTATAEVEKAKGNPWIFIPGGKFLMGSLSADQVADKDEKPQHEVILNGFFIMRNEVTNLEFAACVKAGVCSEPALADSGPLSHYKDPNFRDYPVVGVNWKQSLDFCTFIKGRLPTEAEWEKASRGKEGKTYPWGDQPATCDLLNIKNCKNDVVQVSSYAGGVSPYKMADASGNVWEWVADWYDAGYYQKIPHVSISPAGPKNGTEKVVRAGSWMSDSAFARSASRTKLKPTQSGPDTGFRCVAGGVMAPMCSGVGYRTFCEDPKVPTPDDCVPGQPPVTQGGCGISASGSVSCDGTNNNISISATGSELSGSISGFTCTTSGGTITCSGPKQSAGTVLSVTVCGTPLSTAAYQPSIDDILLAAYSSPLMKTNNGGGGGVSCAPGYTPNYSTLPASCVLDPGYKWPEGALVADGSCPEGYLLNKMIGCCVPGPANPCPVGTFTISSVGKNCTPVGPSGCVEGQVSDGLGHCITDPNYQPPTTPGECPPGFIPTQYGCEDRDAAAASDIGCLADDTGYGGECNPQPNSGNPCAKGYINTPNGCVPGYGPGSGCPNGYMILPGSLCCVPIPGNGSDCPPGDYAYNPGSNACQDTAAVPVVKSCKDFPGTFWNEDLKMCIPYGSDCCPAGQDWTNEKGCIPIVFGNGQETDQSCAGFGDLYQMFNGFCVRLPQKGPQVEPCCVTVSLKAPCCFTSCIGGYTLNPNTHCCDKNPPPADPCAGVDCGACCPSKQCPAGCCTCR